MEILNTYVKISFFHYNDIIMSAMTCQITSLTIVYSTAYSGAHQRKHQSSVSLAFVRGIHRWPVNSLHKGPIMRKMFPFDDVIMSYVFLSAPEMKQNWFRWIITEPMLTKFYLAYIVNNENYLNPKVLPLLSHIVSLQMTVITNPTWYFQ